MVDSLDGLGHHVVVGCHDDDGEVGYLGSAGTHGGEGFMTRGVEECDVATIVELDVVSTDMLGDTSSLAGNNVGIADVVEQ